MTHRYLQSSLLGEERSNYRVDRPSVTSAQATPVYTKDSLVEALRSIRSLGWVPNARPGNAGGVGNTLEDLLGLHENNLPIPNAAEWELKCHRAGSSALCTLFHMEPSPRALNFVPAVLLPNYGWSHQQAGKRYGPGEMSFRQTINAAARSDRGFGIVVDRQQRQVLVSFDASAVDARHRAWLATLAGNVGIKELDPQPYWGFDDLEHKAGSKLLNSFYVQAEVRREGKLELFHYSKIAILQGFSLEGLLRGLEQGDATWTLMPAPVTTMAPSFASVRISCRNCTAKHRKYHDRGTSAPYGLLTSRLHARTAHPPSKLCSPA